jgi:hypothetical protein
VEENASSHLLLAAKKMEDYQKRLKILESNAATLERENMGLKIQMAANAEKYSKDVIRLEKQAKATVKQLSALEKKCNSEFRSHQK